MPFQMSDFIQNEDMSGVVFPTPCTTESEAWDANPHLWEEFADISVKDFRTGIDILIGEILKKNQLNANKYTGRIYNPHTGKILKPKKHKNGYLFFTVRLVENGRILDIPVHRFVYYAAHPDASIGASFDIHHIDGNKENNRAENLDPVPRKLHTCRGANKDVYEAETAYLRFIGATKHGTRVTADIIRAIRVCAKQMPRKSHRKSIIYEYFAKKTGLSHEFCLHLSTGKRGRPVLPATPEQEAQILEEYAWLIETAKAGIYDMDEVMKRKPKTETEENKCT